MGMLKRTIGFLITIALIHSLAYVPQAYAASASIVITHVQPGTLGAATKEFVAIYNNSNEQTEITDWCLRNKSAVNFVCFTANEPDEQAWLPAYSYAVLSSEAYAGSLPQGMFPSLTYVSLNTSSGSLVGSSDTISLIDKTGAVVDSHTWTTSPSGSVLQRKTQVASIPSAYMDTDDASDWRTVLVGVGPYIAVTDQVEWRSVEIEDACTNIDGLQVSTPDGFVSEDGVCESAPQIPLPTISITEMLPNPEGADAGKEYIELYNQEDETIDLNGFSIAYGVAGEKTIFLTDVQLPHQGYGIITNETMSFTLPNTVGSVKLLAPDGRIVHAPPAYENPKDNQAWALFDDIWRYTKHPTPGAENSEPVIDVPPVIVASVALKPCTTSQYRHPETNRCRSLVTTTVQTACRDDQYRSVETGRCRSVTVATAPAACKAGQERNPETNRCRNIRTLTTTDYGILAAKEKTQPNQWYVYASVGVVSAAILSYAVWEWRVEIKKLLSRLRRFVIHR